MDAKVRKLQDYDSDEKPNWCAGCVLPGTYIRTNPSSKPIFDIKSGDKVLGHDGKYHKVTKVLSHVHKGKLYSVTTKFFGTTFLTGEHPVLAVRRQHKKLHNKNFASYWTNAEELKKGDYVVYPIDTTERELGYLEIPIIKLKKDTRSKELPKKVKLDGDLLRLFGYYIAEGYVHDRTICFTFSEKEENYVKDVTTIMKKVFGLNSSVKKREKRHEITAMFHSSILGRLLQDWFGKGAENKTVPGFIMQLPKSKQKTLIKGMWRGDGWVNKEASRANYKTTSQLLCEQLKMLLLRQGIVPVISYQAGYGNHRQAYSVQVVNFHAMLKLTDILELTPPKRKMKSKSPSAIVTTNYAYMPIRKIGLHNYDGLVYNLEVENSNSYVSENASLHNCGDFGIWASLKQAFIKQNLGGDDVLIVYGIGCHGHMVNFTKVNGFEGLHGRPIPAAEGAKLANHKLPIIVVAGDGDTYGEGLGHFITGARSNHNITVIVHNNQVYGLTIGQTSPTSAKGFKTKTTPDGAIAEPINPIGLALASGASFVARGFAGDMQHSAELIKQAMEHKGFALVDIFQPCVTFNYLNTYQWFRERVYKLENENHDSSNMESAMKKAFETERLPIGVFYKEEKQTYEESLPVISHEPLVNQPTKVNKGELLKEFL